MERSFSHNPKSKTGDWEELMLVWQESQAGIVCVNLVQSVTLGISDHKLRIMVENSATFVSERHSLLRVKSRAQNSKDRFRRGGMQKKRNSSALVLECRLMPPSFLLF